MIRGSKSNSDSEKMKKKRRSRAEEAALGNKGTST